MMELPSKRIKEAGKRKSKVDKLFGVTSGLQLDVQEAVRSQVLRDGMQIPPQYRDVPWGDIDVFEAIKAYQDLPLIQSSPLLSTTSKEETGRDESQHGVHLVIHLSAFRSLLQGNNILLYMYLYDHRKQQQVSEAVSFQASHLKGDTKRTCCFPNVGKEMLRDKLYLVIRFMRQGPLKSETANQKDSKSYIRPVAASVIDLSERADILLSTKETSMSTITAYKTLYEKDFGDIHRHILQKTEKAAQLNDLIKLQLDVHVKPESYTQITKQILQPLSRQQRFHHETSPDMFYIMLHRGDFVKGKKRTQKNILVRVTLRDSFGTVVPKSFQNSQYQESSHRNSYESVVYYHCNAPAYRECISLLLPPWKQLQRYHLHFEFHHVSSKVNTTDPFAFGFLPLTDTESGSILKDSVYIVDGFESKGSQLQYDSLDLGSTISSRRRSSSTTLQDSRSQPSMASFRSIGSADDSEMQHQREGRGRSTRNLEISNRSSRRRSISMRPQPSRQCDTHPSLWGPYRLKPSGDTIEVRTILCSKQLLNDAIIQQMTQWRQLSYASFVTLLQRLQDKAPRVKADFFPQLLQPFLEIFSQNGAQDDFQSAAWDSFSSFLETLLMGKGNAVKVVDEAIEKLETSFDSALYIIKKVKGLLSTASLNEHTSFIVLLAPRLLRIACADASEVKRNQTKLKELLQCIENEVKEERKASYNIIGIIPGVCAVLHQHIPSVDLLDFIRSTLKRSTKEPFEHDAVQLDALSQCCAILAASRSKVASPLLLFTLEECMSLLDDAMYEQSPKVIHVLSVLLEHASTLRKEKGRFTSHLKSIFTDVLEIGHAIITKHRSNHDTETGRPRQRKERLFSISPVVTRKRMNLSQHKASPMKQEEDTGTVAKSMIVIMYSLNAFSDAEFVSVFDLAVSQHENEEPQQVESGSSEQSSVRFAIFSESISKSNVNREIKKRGLQHRLVSSGPNDQISPLFYLVDIAKMVLDKPILAKSEYWTVLRFLELKYSIEAVRKCTLLRLSFFPNAEKLQGALLGWSTAFYRNLIHPHKSWITIVKHLEEALSIDHVEKLAEHILSQSFQSTASRSGTSALRDSAAAAVWNIVLYVGTYGSHKSTESTLLRVFEGYIAHGNEFVLEQISIDVLDSYMNANKDAHDRPKRTLDLLNQLKRHPDVSKSALQEQITAFLDDLHEQMTHLSQLVCMDGTTVDLQAEATLQLISLMKNKERELMYERFLVHLIDLYHENEHFMEEGFALLEYASQFEWTYTIVESVKDIPREPSFERKYRLLRGAVESFLKAKLWEYCFPLYRELARIEESMLLNYDKSRQLLLQFADLYARCLTEDRMFNSYFRVCFFGSGFGTSLQNKEFVYCCRNVDAAESVRDFTASIRKIYPGANISNSAELPPANITSDTFSGRFIQISTLQCSFAGEAMGLPNPFDKEHVATRVTEFYEKNRVHVFKYSRQATEHANEYEGANEFARQWVYQVYLHVPNEFPCIRKRQEIVHKEEFLLSPLQNATQMIRSKTREILKVTAQVNEEHPDVGMLSMILNGVIDAAVQGGIKKYREAFFHSDYLDVYPHDRPHEQSFFDALTEQQTALHHGLATFKQYCSESLVPLYTHLSSLYDTMRNEIQHVR